MKPIKSKFRLLFVCSFGLVFFSCEKQNQWLDVKRNRSDVSPSTLSDMQAVLDNSNVFNTGYPMLGLLGTDHFYFDDQNLSAFSQIERNVYLWARDIFQTSSSIDFNLPYGVISSANLVLEGIEEIPVIPSERTRHDQIRGQALFHRAMAYYNLAQLFCKPYNQETAARDLGLQLRTWSDPNIGTLRSTVEQTYQFILSDLNQALPILEEKPIYLTRPGKAACKGLLAKVYLLMKDYENAERYASEAIGGSPVLLDFNSALVNPSEPYVFPAYSNKHTNPEIIFYAQGQSWSSISPNLGIARVDSALYVSYSNLDLRKQAFFRINSQGLPQLVGTYTGSYFSFSGIAANELLLIAAESMARTARGKQALVLLNHLLTLRFVTGKFSSYAFVNNERVLDLVLAERRKELAFTAQIRWEDLRRLPFEQPLLRTYNGQRYEIPFASDRFTFPLPQAELELSGVAQNPR